MLARRSDQVLAMHGRDQKGAVASLTSVAKLPFAYAKDGISYTFSIAAERWVKTTKCVKPTCTGLMDGYFHHEASNRRRSAPERQRNEPRNAARRDGKPGKISAADHPCIWLYAVRFNSLTKEQQQDVIARTFTQTM